MRRESSHTNFFSYEDGAFGNPVRIVKMAKVQKDMHEITIRNGNKAYNTKEAIISNNKMKPSDKPQLLKRLDSSNSSSSFVSKTSISFKDRINSYSSSSPNTSTAKLCYTIPKRSSSNPNMVKDADSQFQSRVPNLEKETPGSGKKIPESSRPKSNNKSKANDPEKKSSPVNNKPYSSRQPSQGDSLLGTEGGEEELLDLEEYVKPKIHPAMVSKGLPSKYPWVPKVITFDKHASSNGVSKVHRPPGPLSRMSRGPPKVEIISPGRVKITNLGSTMEDEYFKSPHKKRMKLEEKSLKPIKNTEKCIPDYKKIMKTEQVPISLRNTEKISVEGLDDILSLSSNVKHKKGPVGPPQCRYGEPDESCVQHPSTSKYKKVEERTLTKQSRTIRIVDMKLMMMTTVDMVRLDDKTIDKIIGSNLDVVSKTSKKDQDKKLSSSCTKALISEALTQQQTINRRPYIPDTSDCSKEKFAKDFSDDASNHENGYKDPQTTFYGSNPQIKSSKRRKRKRHDDSSDEDFIPKSTRPIRKREEEYSLRDRNKKKNPMPVLKPELHSSSNATKSKGDDYKTKRRDNAKSKSLEDPNEWLDSVNSGSAKLCKGLVNYPNPSKEPTIWDPPLQNDQGSTISEIIETRELQSPNIPEVVQPELVLEPAIPEVIPKIINEEEKEEQKAEEGEASIDADNDNANAMSQKTLDGYDSGVSDLSTGERMTPKEEDAIQIIENQAFSWKDELENSAENDEDPDNIPPSLSDIITDEAAEGDILKDAMGYAKILSPEELPPPITTVAIYNPLNNPQKPCTTIPEQASTPKTDPPYIFIDLYDETVNFRDNRFSEQIPTSNHSFDHSHLQSDSSNPFDSLGMTEIPLNHREDHLSTEFELDDMMDEIMIQKKRLTAAESVANNVASELQRAEQLREYEEAEKVYKDIDDDDQEDEEDESDDKSEVVQSPETETDDKDDNPASVEVIEINEESSSDSDEDVNSVPRTSSPMISSRKNAIRARINMQRGKYCGNMQSEVEIVDLVDLDEDELPSKSAAFVPEIIECGDTSSEESEGSGDSQATKLVPRNKLNPDSQEDDLVKEAIDTVDLDSSQITIEDLPQIVVTETESQKEDPKPLPESSPTKNCSTDKLPEKIIQATESVNNELDSETTPTAIVNIAIEQSTTENSKNSNIASQVPSGTIAKTDDNIFQIDLGPIDSSETGITFYADIPNPTSETPHATVKSPVASNNQNPSNPIHAKSSGINTVVSKLKQHCQEVQEAALNNIKPTETEALNNPVNQPRANKVSRRKPSITTKVIMQTPTDGIRILSSDTSTLNKTPALPPPTSNDINFDNMLRTVCPNMIYVRRPSDINGSLNSNGNEQVKENSSPEKAVSISIHEYLALPYPKNIPPKPKRKYTKKPKPTEPSESDQVPKSKNLKDPRPKKQRSDPSSSSFNSAIGQGQRSLLLPTFQPTSHEVPLVPAPKPDSSSSEELLEKLKVCPVCKVKYTFPCKADKCLLNHGFKRCWICFQLVFITSIETLKRHNQLYHPTSNDCSALSKGSKCRFCDEFLPFDITFRNHMETTHFNIDPQFLSTQESSTVERRVILERIAARITASETITRDPTEPKRSRMSSNHTATSEETETASETNDVDLESLACASTTRTVAASRDEASSETALNLSLTNKPPETQRIQIVPQDLVNRPQSPARYSPISPALEDADVSAPNALDGHLASSHIPAACPNSLNFSRNSNFCIDYIRSQIPNSAGNLNPSLVRPPNSGVCVNPIYYYPPTPQQFQMCINNNNSLPLSQQVMYSGGQVSYAHNMGGMNIQRQVILHPQVQNQYRPNVRIQQQRNNKSMQMRPNIRRPQQRNIRPLPYNKQISQGMVPNFQPTEANHLNPSNQRVTLQQEQYEYRPQQLNYAVRCVDGCCHVQNNQMPSHQRPAGIPNLWSPAQEVQIVEEMRQAENSRNAQIVQQNIQNHVYQIPSNPNISRPAVPSQNQRPPGHPTTHQNPRIIKVQCRHAIPNVNEAPKPRGRKRKTDSIPQAQIQSTMSRTNEAPRIPLQDEPTNGSQRVKGPVALPTQQYSKTQSPSLQIIPYTNNVPGVHNQTSVLHRIEVPRSQNQHHQATSNANQGLNAIRTPKSHCPNNTNNSSKPPRIIQVGQPVNVIMSNPICQSSQTQSSRSGQRPTATATSQKEISSNVSEIIQNQKINENDQPQLNPRPLEPLNSSNVASSGSGTQNSNLASSSIDSRIPRATLLTAQYRYFAQQLLINAPEMTRNINNLIFTRWLGKLSPEDRAILKPVDEAALKLISNSSASVPVQGQGHQILQCVPGAKVTTEQHPPLSEETLDAFVTFGVQSFYNRFNDPSNLQELMDLGQTLSRSQ